MKRYAPELLEKLLPLLTATLEQEPVAFAYLLGTAARGEPFRDLDVAYHSGGQIVDRLDFTLDCGARLEKLTGVPVDLVPLEDTSLAFRHRASQGRLLVCRDPGLLARWKEDTWRRYFDLAPRLRTHGLELLKSRGV